MKFNKERRWWNSPVAGFCCNPWIRCVLNFDKCQPPCNFRVYLCSGTIFRLGIRLLFLSMCPWGKEWGRHLYCLYFLPGVMVKFTRKSRGHFAIILYLLKSACMQLHAFLDILFTWMCYLCPARKFLRILKIVIVVDKFSQGTSFKLLVHFPLLSPLFISLAGEQCLLVWGWGFLYRCCSSWIRISPAQWWITLETGELSIISFIIHSKYFPVSDWLKPHA